MLFVSMMSLNSHEITDIKCMGTVLNNWMEVEDEDCRKLLFFTYSRFVNRLTDSFDRLTRVKCAT